ncbi:Type IV fimbrial assembly protein PilC, partial [hydrothermal vent metagenome]
PIEVFPAESSHIKSEEKKIPPAFSFAKKISLTQLSVFTRQMYDLVDANVPLLRALRLVSQQTNHPFFKKIIVSMCTSVEQGGSFSGALAQHKNIFSRLYVNMIKAGEMSGNLNVVLDRLSGFIESEQETRSKVNAALFYPTLIMSVGGLTIFVLMAFVIPRLTVMFDDLGQSLPLITVILISVSSIFAKFWWLILIITAVGIVQMKRLRNTSKGKLWMDGVLLKMPILGRFIKDVEISRFARTLGTLLESGVVIVTALGSVCEVIENEVLRQDIMKVADEVKKGGRLTKALGKCSFVPESTVNMMAIGEETGAFERGLYKLADSHARKSAMAVKTMTALLEPILILCIGSIVGFIVIAMLLPLFQMNMMM